MAETGLGKMGPDAALMEKAVIEGDLTNLTPQEQVAYYAKVCDSLGLNPYTKPFSYIRLNNRLVLYANRDCCDQLRRRDGISITIQAREVLGDVYVVTAQASTKEGRTDASIGAVPIKGLSGEFLANAYMKAETKAKRRVTLSIVGLGWLDETEVESLPDAQLVKINPATGEIQAAAEAPKVDKAVDIPSAPLAIPIPGITDKPYETGLPSRPATQAQKGFIQGLLDTHKLPIAIVEKYLGHSMGEATAAEASDVISKLRKGELTG